MPKIQEYLPEQDAAGPQGALAPNLEQVGALGQGVKDLGRSLEQASDSIYTRQVSLQKDDATSNVTNQKLDEIEDQNAKIADGSYDVDTHKQALYDWQNQQAANYDLPEAKSWFMRQSTRMIGGLISRGMRGQAIVNGNNAKATQVDALDTDASSVLQAPDQLQDTLHSNYERIEELPLNDAQKEVLNKTAENTLAVQAVLGTAKQDPDKAMKMLQDKDIGALLNPKDLDSLYKSVTAAQKNNEDSDDRQATLELKASKARGEAMINKITPDIVSGKVQSRDVILGTLPGSQDLDFDTKMAVANKINEMQRLVQKTSPTQLRQIEDRMLLPKTDPMYIADPSTLYKEGINLSPQDINRLNRDYFSPGSQGEKEKAAERDMTKVIADKLRAPVSGTVDIDHNNLVNQQKAKFNEVKTQMIKNGEDWTQLTDPTSKMYFPNQVKARDPIAFMQQQAQAAISGLKPQEQPVIYTSPGVNPHTVPDGVKAPSNDSPASNEVKVPLKSGKTAVYDSKTKKLLRTE